MRTRQRVVAVNYGAGDFLEDVRQQARDATGSSGGIPYELPASGENPSPFPSDCPAATSAKLDGQDDGTLRELCRYLLDFFPRNAPHFLSTSAT